MPRKLILILLYGLLSAGCASVVNVEKGSKENVGFEHYPANFYLVIEPTKDGRVARVVSLPDVTRPHYIKYKKGFGKLDFSFKLSKGILTEFGQVSDSGGPATLAALGAIATGYGGLLAGSAAVIGAEATANKMTPPTEGSFQPLLLDQNGLTITVLVTAADNLGTVAKDIGDLADQLPNGAATSTLLEKIEAAIQQQAMVLRDAAVIGDAEDVLKQVDTAQKITKSSIMGLVTQYNKLNEFLAGLEGPDHRALVGAQIDLANALIPLRTFAAQREQIEMYEIIEDQNGNVGFRPVLFEEMPGKNN